MFADLIAFYIGSSFCDVNCGNFPTGYYVVLYDADHDHLFALSVSKEQHFSLRCADPFDIISAEILVDVSKAAVTVTDICVLD